MKKILYMLAFTLFIFSCSKENLDTSAYETETTSFKEVEALDALRNENQSQSQSEATDLEYIAAQVNLSMISFVNGIRPYHQDEATYEDIKFSLDPENELASMTDEADALLYQAYLHINNNTPDNEMGGEKLILAFQAVFERNPELDLQSNPEAFELAYMDLFQLADDYEPEYESQGCKWYQVGCHAGWLWETIAGWWGADAGGDPNKGPTNGDIVEVLIDVLKYVGPLFSN